MCIIWWQSYRHCPHRHLSPRARKCEWAKEHPESNFGWCKAEWHDTKVDDEPLKDMCEACTNERAQARNKKAIRTTESHSPNAPASSSQRLGDLSSRRVRTSPSIADDPRNYVYEEDSENYGNERRGEASSNRLVDDRREQKRQQSQNSGKRPGMEELKRKANMDFFAETAKKDARPKAARTRNQLLLQDPERTKHLAEENKPDPRAYPFGQTPGASEVENIKRRTDKTYRAREALLEKSHTHKGARRKTRPNTAQIGLERLNMDKDDLKNYGQDANAQDDTSGATEIDNIKRRTDLSPWYKGELIDTSFYFKERKWRYKNDPEALESWKKDQKKDLEKAYPQKSKEDRSSHLAPNDQGKYSPPSGVGPSSIDTQRRSNYRPEREVSAPRSVPGHPRTSERANTPAAASLEIPIQGMRQLSVMPSGNSAQSRSSSRRSSFNHPPIAPNEAAYRSGEGGMRYGAVDEFLSANPMRGMSPACSATKSISSAGRDRHRSASRGSSPLHVDPDLFSSSEDETAKLRRFGPPVEQRATRPPASRSSALNRSASNTTSSASRPSASVRSPSGAVSSSPSSQHSPPPKRPRTTSTAQPTQSSLARSSTLRVPLSSRGGNGGSRSLTEQSSAPLTQRQSEGDTRDRSSRSHRTHGKKSKK
ncbi:hypothetical protein DM02DRAFT_621568 [Periconia macrospinosa]|uniref:Uncharacterized protein n=1 Tax=Periconia macrospinosa TaxID=97972 RepID=A0A2V1EEA2_9PLEO|nr:hypothetical protein DM02DRAFT_621568 [Periconia macrospinosa]